MKMEMYYESRLSKQNRHLNHNFKQGKVSLIFFKILFVGKNLNRTFFYFLCEVFLNNAM